MPNSSRGAVDFSKINSDMDPSTPNVFDIGKVGAEWRNARIGGDLVVGGSLTVEGPITTIESTTLTVEDKNIELASSPSPTDALADGGGITLRGTTDKTILWRNATDSWDFNQAIRTGNLELNGNTISSTDVNGNIVWSPNGTGKVTTAGALDVGQLNADNLRLDGNTLSTITGDLDVTTQTGGVFKFTVSAFRSGQDAINYLEIGHGGSNAFINAVGAGGQDFRFGGVTKASFTPAGHLHLLTDTDQKHTLKIKTADNLKETGIAWENSGGNFSQTIFRNNVGSNRSDLIFAIGSDSDIDLLTNSFKIHGSAAFEGRLEVLSAFQISSGSPGVNKVLTSDATGIATWQTASAGGWVDDGTAVRLATSTDDVVIGANTGFGAPLELVGDTPGTVGGFASGAFQVRSPSTLVNANAVITGHNSFGANKQLWYLGSTSSSSDAIAFINRQTGSLSLITSGNGDLLLSPNGTGKVGISKTPTEKLDVNGNIKADTIIDKSIFVSLSSSVDQDPTDTNPTVITYNTQGKVSGLTHSTTVNPGEITIVTEGLYMICPQPQVGKTSGSQKIDFDMFLQVDRGSGFVDEPDSNIKLTIKDADLTDVIVSVIPVELNVGDIIRLMQRVSSSTVGMGLKNTDPVVGPPTTPRTPSIIFAMWRKGGLAV